VAHTWPVGTKPRLLASGTLLDAVADASGAWQGLVELDWTAAPVWEQQETRAGYRPHDAFARIHNPLLGADTTLYLAAGRSPTPGGRCRLRPRQRTL